MSYWDQGRTIRRNRLVDVERLASISAELLDKGGLRALTIRAVAQRMGVAPASLYSRVMSVDDLFDLALDYVLGCDRELQKALEYSELHALLITYYRHLVRHHWACQVIAMRAPRGPNYLHLSERMCVLLTDDGSCDPLGEAYALSNFVIGSAATAPVAGGERCTAVNSELAPLYASLHEKYSGNPETIVTAGLRILLQGGRTMFGNCSTTERAHHPVD